MPHEFKDDTLRDIKLRDLENLRQVFKRLGKKSYTFETIDQAANFCGSRLHDALEKLGVNLARMSSQSDEDVAYLDDFMTANNIRVENRTYDPARVDPDISQMEEDTWRGGLYIYKNEEIVTFIGTPVFITNHYNVITTEKVA